jgi:DNA polymerase-3 subunit delta
VRNELATLPFLSRRRLVVVEQADAFITDQRKKLEVYVEAPCPTGVLVLDVKSWTSTTNLAKLLGDAAIACKTPSAGRLPEWCQKWCGTQYAKELTAPAARLLVDLVGADMGQLDQELNKLSLYVGAASLIDTADVDRLVNNSRSEDTWRIFNLIGAGKGGPALAHLDRLLTQGEDPIKILGAFSYQLRRLAHTARLASKGKGLRAAMDLAGVPTWSEARQGAEQLLRHLGWHRVDRLFDLLIQTDLGMKTTAQIGPRMLLERLVVQLASPTA